MQQILRYSLLVFIFFVGSVSDVFGQSAENLNLRTPVKEPYNCYGKLSDGCPNAELLGWKVGIQCYTFNKYSFFEAIDLTKALGLKYIEATVGSKLSKDGTDRIGPGMSEENKMLLRKKLSDSGVRCQSVYAGMNGSGEGFEELVKFCKEMGWMIVTDPKREVNGGVPVSFYENILDRYGVTMVFTNHPKSAAYWNPDFTVEDTEGKGPHIGASVDFGHYMRGGFDAFEAAERYAAIGKMYHFHLRDVSAINPHGLDVPCGTGAGRLDELCDMLAERDIRPMVMIEYEHDFDNPLPYLIKSIDYLNEKCGKIIEGRIEASLLAEPVRLYASEAYLTGNLRLEGSAEDATIHDWCAAEQKIEWSVDLEKGDYLVQLRYSQPREGSAVEMILGRQEMASLIEPTFTWYDYKEQVLGVISVEQDGKTTISLRAIQKALEYDNKGNYKAVEAMPDIHWIQLTKTSLPSDSQSVDIYQLRGTPIFDGKTYDGWEPNNGEETMRHFRIAQRSIVGGNMKQDLDHNEFLRTKKMYRNFQLHLKYRVKATDDSYNGGVQFRSIKQTAENAMFEMIGYQGDIISWKYGALYDEQRRWDFLGLQLESAEGYDASEWNDYVIRCEGSHVKIWVNGIKTTDYIEPFIDTALQGFGFINDRGHIALQIHEGKASEIWYKDIDIIDLDE